MRRALWPFGCLLLVVVLGCSSATGDSFGENDFVGEWKALSAGAYIFISEENTYRFGVDPTELPPDINYDDFVIEQGRWEISDSALTFVSNEFSRNCKEGNRGEYRITPLDNGEIRLNKLSDECPNRGGPTVVTLQRVQK